ncbi:2832_t:CDS:1, partial [Dentiscutata heterogama]
NAQRVELLEQKNFNIIHNSQVSFTVLGYKIDVNENPDKAL